MPWSVQLLPWGINKEPRPTVVRGTLVGEVLLDEWHEMLQVWRYVESLRAENQRLRMELETTVLLAAGPPAPTEPSAPPADLPLSAIDATTPTPANNLPDSEIPASPPDGTVYQNAAGNLAVTVAAELPAPTEDKRTRAVRELLADPTASNPVLAERAGCSDEYVRRLRRQLQDEGQLPAGAVKKDDANDAPTDGTNTTDSLVESAVGAVVAPANSTSE
jgi:hypothetical protein